MTRPFEQLMVEPVMVERVMVERVMVERASRPFACSELMVQGVSGL